MLNLLFLKGLKYGLYISAVSMLFENLNLNRVSCNNFIMFILELIFMSKGINNKVTFNDHLEMLKFTSFKIFFSHLIAFINCIERM